MLAPEVWFILLVDGVFLSLLVGSILVLTTNQDRRQVCLLASATTRAWSTGSLAEPSERELCHFLWLAGRPGVSDTACLFYTIL